MNILSQAPSEATSEKASEYALPRPCRPGRDRILTRGSPLMISLMTSAVPSGEESSMNRRSKSHDSLMEACSSRTFPASL